MKSTAQLKSVIYISIIAALGGFLFGFDTAVISGTIDSIKTVEYGFGLSSGELGFAVASVLFGSAIGAWYAGLSAMRFGRVRVMIIASIMFFISALGSALATGLWSFVLWRFIGGIGVGIAAVIAPAYIAEVSPAHGGKPMQPTPNSQELAQIMRFVQSPAGQQLLASLQQLNSNEINSAMATISAFLATPEAKKLLSQVEGGK